MLTWWYWDVWRWTGAAWESLGNRMEHTNTDTALQIGPEMARVAFEGNGISRCFTWVDDAWQECPAG